MFCPLNPTIVKLISNICLSNEPKLFIKLLDSTWTNAVQTYVLIYHLVTLHLDKNWTNFGPKLLDKL